MNTSDDPPLHDLLFVYGTLRHGCSGAQARRLAGESERLGEARIVGLLYRIGSYPGLCVGKAGETGNGAVTGDLVRLHDPAATLAWLDAYEETGPAFPEPWEYRRCLLDVTAAGGATPAWAYIYSWPVDGLMPLAEGDWLAQGGA